MNDKPIKTNRLRAFAIGLVVALSVFVSSHKLFLWAFIKYWEWQHDGRPMKFTFWADERALPWSVLAFAVVFFVTFTHFRCDRS